MALQSIVPIAFRKEMTPGQEAITILAADIGGTKTNVALCYADHNGVTITEKKRYVSKDFGSLSDIIHDFSKGRLPERISAEDFIAGMPMAPAMPSAAAALRNSRRSVIGKIVAQLARQNKSSSARPAGLFWEGQRAAVP